MIHQNLMIEDVTKSPIPGAIFGMGTLMVASFHGEDGSILLALKSLNKPHKIGEDAKGYNPTLQEFEPELVMIFHNTESIDVVLDHLKSAKKRIKEVK